MGESSVDHGYLEVMRSCAPFSVLRFSLLFLLFPAVMLLLIPGNSRGFPAETPMNSAG
jgi:hypothetical protein